MSIETEFSTALRKRLGELKERTDATILDPIQITSFDWYRYAIGYKKACSDFETIMDEILKDIQEG